MKATKTLMSTLLALASFSAGAWAQTTSTPPTTPPSTSVTAADVQALKDALAAQQQQIDRLTRLLEHQQTSETAVKTEAPQAQPVSQTQPAALTNAVMIQQGPASSSGLNIQDTQTGPDQNPMHGPMSIHFKGITLTPAGFVAAEFVRRSRELAADVITPFNNVTMPGASQSNLPEFFGTARQSRPTVYIDGHMKNVELSSYVSGDFLSSGTTSNNNQTNSYTFRLRQAWGQAKFDNGWKIIGGQMWSLVTEMKAGIAPSDDIGRTNDARPTTIDGQYSVGFTFARQYGIRLTKDFGTKASIAFSMENAQGTLTTHNNGDNFLLGELGATNEANAFNGTYTANPAPDLIVKAAFDPGIGHYEIFGLADRFTDRIFPCGEVAATVSCAGQAVGATSSIGAYNASKEGGGFGANARWTVDNKHIVFGVHGFGGNGVGRYGAAGLSDLSIHANGTLDLIRGYQGLGTLEWHGKKLDLYSYAGAEYASRTYDFDQITGKYVGYGAPQFPTKGCYTELPPAVGTGFTPTALANCTADTRVIMEGTVGFWYRFYSGPRGRFQFGTQYSYLTRQTWSGAGITPTVGTTPSGLDNMVFTSFRYYLP